MGGKNKKHKAPGAAAVRAAVSASRAKSAEVGAFGEAQNKKSVARPPPAAAACTREPRVKQGTRGPGAPGFPPRAAAAVPRQKLAQLGRALGLKICYLPHMKLLVPYLVALL